MLHFYVELRSFSCTVILFLSPGINTQSHWPNLGRGSKTLEKLN